MRSRQVDNAPLMDEIAAERTELAEVLGGLSPDAWDAQSLCAGWRVREVVAHMTMPFRYSTRRFVLEVLKDRGRFNRMADRCAHRDATMPTGELVAALADNAQNPWRPPGGGLEGALVHDVIHGLDITVALGIDRKVPEGAPAHRPRFHFATEDRQVLRRRSGRDRAAGRRHGVVVRVRGPGGGASPGSGARLVRPKVAGRTIAG